MEKNELIKIAEAIATKINVDQIYCLGSADFKVQSSHIVLLLPHNIGTKFSELEPLVNMALDGYENVSFAMFHTSDVAKSLEEGNIFFHLLCLSDNLLYQKPDSPTLPQSDASQILSWANGANIRFKDGLNKTTSFLEGADFYNKKDEAELTVFMLHQVTELTYRALELCLLTTEKRTHNISIHQKYLTPFLPQLGILFPNDTTEEKEILKTLNNSYSKVRYEQNHIVEKEHVPILFERVTKFLEKSKTIVSDLILALEMKSLKSPSVKVKVNEPEPKVYEVQSEEATTSLTVGELDNIVDLIVEHLSADRIYLFGNNLNTTKMATLFALDQNKLTGVLHYDLLVISPIQNPYNNNIHDLVNKNSDIITLNLLIHTKEEVMKKLQADNIKGRNRFFETVCRDGALLYTKPNIIDKSKIKPDEKAMHSKAAEYSLGRINAGMALKRAATEIKDDACRNVTLALLSQGIEQVCLGLIYAFWGYRPNLQSLPHLLNLCKVFWSEGEIYLPRQTEYDKYLFRLLANANSVLRFTVGEPLEQEDFNALFDRCSSYIDIAEMTCLHEIDVLEHQPIQEVKNVDFNIAI